MRALAAGRLKFVDYCVELFPKAAIMEAATAI
jgi:hypothetical protein